MCNYDTLAVTAEQCSNEGAVKLVNGTSPNEGKVMICYNRRWGTACSTGWGSSEATVVCKELGFKCMWILDVLQPLL